MRLDKFLVHMGICSRKEAKMLVKKKRIKVNDIIASKSDMKIDENNDCIYFDDEYIEYKKYYYLMLNKPAGYISATEDKYDDTVLDLIEGYDHVDLFPIGRLDKDTEGLLILTNNGDLAHYLLSPKHHIVKKYYAVIDQVVTKEDVEAFKQGMDLGDFTSMPSLLEIINDHEVYVSIHEGKFHQIKRMFEKQGKHVEYLKRVSMGEICLDSNLDLGNYRELDKEEIEFLKQSSNVMFF